MTAGVVTLLSFARRGAPNDARAKVVEPIEVAVAAFDAGAASAEIVLPARVKASEEVTLAARIQGRLTALPAREGQRVRRGDPVALFAAPEVQRALSAARAERVAAERSRAVATRQEERMESLYVSRVVAERDREIAVEAGRSADARLESARAALDALSSGSTVRAPFDGVVVRTHIDPGTDLVPGAPLVDLRSTAGIEILVDLPEDAASRVADFTLTVEVGGGPWRPARLARLEGMTDWRSRTRTAHLAIEGDADPGAFARVALSTRSSVTPHEAGSVPVESLVRRGALGGVFVIDGGEAQLRWLQLGRTRGNRVEILAGLEAGEFYALSPRELVDGRAVRIR